MEHTPSAVEQRGSVGVREATGGRSHCPSRASGRAAVMADDDGGGGGGDAQSKMSKKIAQLTKVCSARGSLGSGGDGGAAMTHGLGATQQCSGATFTL